MVNPAVDRECDASAGAVSGGERRKPPITSPTWHFGFEWGLRSSA